jgi:opacity protein-like surface antigen
MIGRGQSRKKIAVLTSAALSAAIVPGWAQQTEPPPGGRFTLDLSAGASVDDNEGLDDPSLGTTTRTNVGATLRFLDETAVSSLAVSLFTRAEYADSPDRSIDGFDFRLPTATAAYTRLGANSRLALTGRYVFERVDDDVLIFLDESLNPVDLVLDTGELRRVTLGGTLSTGIEGPLGVDVGVSFDDRDYSGTTDPDLYDRRNVGVNGALRFQLNPVLSGRLTASYSRLDEDTFGDPLTETTAYGVGLTYALDEITVITGDLRATTIEETVFGVTSVENDGLAFSLGVQRETPGGAVGGQIARTVEEAATRTQLSVNRATDLRDGSIAWSLGYSFSDDDGDGAVIGSLDYSRELRTARVSAQLSQQAISDDDGDDTLVTRIALGYTQEINSVSSVGVNFGLGRSDDLGAGDDSTTRLNLGVNYRRALTRDWDWVLGYEARYLSEDDGDTANSNRVFTRIDRSFTFRP